MTEVKILLLLVLGHEGFCVRFIDYCLILGDLEPPFFRSKSIDTARHGRIAALQRCGRI